MREARLQDASSVVLAALHLTRYFGVLSSHASSRSEVVPAPAEPTPTPAGQIKPAGKSKYIPWAELLRKSEDDAAGAHSVDFDYAECGSERPVPVRQREGVQEMLSAVMS